MQQRSPEDLVTLAFSGIQRYIEESHSTADLGNASWAVSTLAAEAARSLEEGGGELVIPARPASSGAPRDVPNRIVALAPEGRGQEMAERAADDVRQVWHGWMAALFT